ncbi:MAG: aldehyde ferredoxin oxidoreductase family protein [Clostridiales bacterium]|nr:aldehyde ferredoxin oxidoreductase family protein [Clostridiales bacterium]
MYGYTGKYLRINLTTGKINVELLNEKNAENFIGGRGLGTKMYMDEVDPEIEPFSEDNKILFVTGPVTGISAPAGSRYMVVTKSPLSGTIASSNSGGFWGPELKFAGYDLIIVEGKSEKPVYIYINNEHVEIRDAAEYWGGLVTDVTNRIKEATDPKAKVLTIGPGGENLSLIASVMNEKDRAAGRSGVGAVMGSKNLKAIAVRGTNKVEVYDKEALMKTYKESLVKIKENGVTGSGLPTYGTAVLVNIINEAGMLPTNNFQLSQFADADDISGETLADKFLIKNTACYGCPIACGRHVRIGDGEGGGPEYETIWAFGSDLGINDLNEIILANHMCNEMGIDTISAGSTLAAAMELYQRGYIKDEELDGMKLEFGDAASMTEWMRKTGLREGFGDKIALGSYRLAESYGRSDLSMSVKKLEMPAYDPRGVQGQGLNYATSNRGGCHVRGYMISPEILSLPQALDRFETKDKPVWTKIFQDLTAAIDSLGFCLFTSFALGADDYAEFMNAATGMNFDGESILKAGERIYNLEKLYNLEAGIAPSEDTLPPRLLNDAIEVGPSKGRVHELGILLPEYYSERGWDSIGIPTEKKLKELGID